MKAMLIVVLCLSGLLVVSIVAHYNTLSRDERSLDRGLCEARLDDARGHAKRMYEAWRDAHYRLSYVCPAQFPWWTLATGPTTNRQLPPLTPDEILLYNRCAEAAAMKRLSP